MKNYYQTSKWLATLSFGLMLSQAHAAIFTVNDKNDPAGTSTCIAPANCSLRQAITAANLTTTADTIKFSFATIGPTAPNSIEDAPEVLPTTVVFQPTSALPIITQPVTIDGYSVSGSLVNTNSDSSNARIRIHLNGINAGNNAVGLNVCANNVLIRGLAITNFGNAGISFGQFGVCNVNITGVSAHGNFIGLTPAGAAGGNVGGIVITSANADIGSATLADRNVISSNALHGIALTGAGTANTIIAGNLIGTDPTGLLDRGNAARGVDVGGNAANVFVGTAGAPNKIAFNNVGVSVRDTLNNRINFNKYGPNDALGIDLLNPSFTFGVSPNDAGDADAGGNGQQNYLNDGNFAATRTSSGININGTLQRIASSTQVFTITAYATASCDASGHGEGEILLGSATESTTTGNAGINVDIVLATQPPFGSFVTTTVTSPGGSTSEFSVCDALDPLPLVVNSTNDVGDGACNAAHCSLRDAIFAANLSAQGDTIQFAINPAVTTGELLIQPTTPLPTITRPVLIDGYTQSGTAVNTDPSVSNAVLRVRVDGALPNSGPNLISVCSEDVTIRGLAITGMTIGGGRGIDICNTVSSGVLIAGDFIGLTTGGVTASGNDTGIFINAPATVGGIAAADRNVIASQDVGQSILLQGHAGTKVLGNLIGTDKSGTLGRCNVGIKLNGGTTDAVIGAQNAPNLIRFCTGAIKTNANTSIVGNQWAYNQIADSTFGIDLNGDGVTVNDLNDADTGPNGLHNFPVITRAERTATGIVIAGRLDVPVGTSATDYLIGVYANVNCDASGFGEGERLLGAATVSLRGINEDFSFVLNTDDPLEPGVQITSIANGPEGSSEFSACVPATDPVAGIAVDSRLDVGLTALGCDVPGDSNECTLREAITLANANADVSLIRFEIAGTGNAANGAHEIVAATALPIITAPLTLDGYLSQAGASANTAATGSDADIKIQLSGAGAGTTLLRVCSAGTVEIRGLALVRAGNAILTGGAPGACPAGTLLVSGNFIGVDPSGAGAGFGNTLGVVSVGARATIGGPELGDRNIIANNSNGGLVLSAQGANGSVVQNNQFGAGFALFNTFENGVADILLSDVSNTSVGGEGLALNRFRQSPNAIVVLGNSASGNQLYANAFTGHSGATAIDLSSASGANGIDINDVNDVDVGPNQLQNSPNLTDASVLGGGISLNGVLDVPTGIVTPENYLIAFYESTRCNDQSGVNNGREGQVYLGAQTVALASNAENFNVLLNLPPSNSGSFLTATATAPNGSTSEFSNCLAEPVVDAMFADGFEN